MTAKEEREIYYALKREAKEFINNKHDREAANRIAIKKQREIIFRKLNDKI